MGMEEQTVYFIQCDGCHSDNTYEHADETAAEEEAEASGWLNDGNSWICPKCRKRWEAERRAKNA
jgi:uncharacterized Zn ribbon protein